MPKISIYSSDECCDNALKAVKFLQTKKIAYPTTKVTHKAGSFLAQSLKIHLLALGSDSRKLMVLRKTNFVGKIPLNEVADVGPIMSELSKLGAKLTTECNLFPCPKTYALFHVLKNRMGRPPRTVNALLEQYWFPTFKMVSFDEKNLTIKISVPPVVKEKEEEIIEAMAKILKRRKITIDGIERGFVSYFDLDLSNIVAMACLCHANASLDLVVD